ncbi:MAG: hypothetical protein ACOYNY_40620 [Caldilineaceae bacterium]
MLHHALLRRSLLLSMTALLALLLVTASTDLRAQEAQQAVAPAVVQAIGNAFTYQGRLTDSGAPANGVYDFVFALFDATSGGTQLGTQVSLSDVSVVNGNFTAVLEFGANLFDTGLRYLQIGVRPGTSEGAFTQLQPRRPVTPAPVAMSAQQAQNLSVGTLMIGDSPTHVFKVVQSDPTTTGYRYAFVGQVDAPRGEGVRGGASHPTGKNYGVYGSTKSHNGFGGYFTNLDVMGTGTGVGLYARGPSLAGLFAGNVQVTGNIIQGSSSLKIDHPLDPTNKYLFHSIVESPDMMNIYNGNVTLDERGEAWVTLPDWFEALNQEFRYQLTAIGGPGPNLYIAKTIENNRFQIAGGSPALTVSWQVTGVRHDPYAEQNRIQVEVDKPAEERGTYLYPEAYGAPKEQGASFRKVEMFEPATTE